MAYRELLLAHRVRQI